MNEHASDQSTPEEHEASADPQRPRAFARTRKVVRFLAAVDTWKKQTSILKHRASFPLLRRVLSLETQRREREHLLKDIDDRTLHRSKTCHALLALLMAPALFWGLINVAQGLAALIKFDIYLNSWLVVGIPFSVYAGIKLVTSYASYKVMKGEIDRRLMSIPNDRSAANAS